MPGFQITTKNTIEPKAEYFDRRIAILGPNTTIDGQGGNTTTYSTIANSPKWAHMEPWKGRVVFEGQQPFAHAYERLVLRYKKTVNINTTMRVAYKSRTYVIRWVGVPAEARKVIELLCEELQAQGSVA